MKFAFPLLFCALFASCFNEGDCLISATNYMHVQFKKKSSITVDTAIAFTGITVSGTDSVLTYTATVTEILLPIDIGHPTTTFIFHRINTLDSAMVATDTLQVQYTTQSKIIAPSCGAFTYYQNLKLEKTSLNTAQYKVFSTSLLKDPASTGTAAYAVNYQIFY